MHGTRARSWLLTPLFFAFTGCASSSPPTDGNAGSSGASSGGSAGTGGTNGGTSGTAATTANGGGGTGSSPQGGAGATAAGGASAGSAAGGNGAGTAGAATTGGASNDGGTANAGGATGGTTSGGSGDAGAAGGNATGGNATGGNATGGNAGVAGADTGGSGGTGNTEPTFHVFLLLGQSNMAGYAKAQAADKIEDPRVRVLGFDACAETGRQVDAWDTAAPPLHECWNSAVGPGDHFAKTLLAALPPDDTIGLVPCAISGERIETFLKVGGTRYDWILDRGRLAQEAGGVIDGILFHQGESNNGDSAWPGKVNTLVTDLRADLGIGDVPFLAGELVGNGAGHNTQVNRLPDLVTNAHVISAAGLVVDPADTQWNLHFDHDSTVTLGIRYAEKMIDVLGL